MVNNVMSKDEIAIKKNSSRFELNRLTYYLEYEIRITKQKKSEKNNEVQGPITKMLNDKFKREKINL
jgi:hypothetical protein